MASTENRYSFIPRGLSRVAAAQYVGISTAKFDELVKDGRMPAPRRIDGRVLWDKNEVDISFDALPIDNARTEFNPCDALLKKGK